MYSVLYCTVATVQSVHCVHKLTSQHGDKRSCQYFHDLRMNNTSSQGHKKSDQFNKICTLWVIPLGPASLGNRYEVGMGIT